MRKHILYMTAILFTCSLILALSSQDVSSAPLSWEYLTPTGTARSNHTLTLLSDGRLLVVGGNQGGDTYLNSATIYDPLRGTWSNAASMNYSRSGHTANLLPDGRVLVCGGKGIMGIGQANILNSAEIYDPISDTWELLSTTMSSPRQYHTATLLNDGRLLLVGGQTSLLKLSDTV